MVLRVVFCLLLLPFGNGLFAQVPAASVRSTVQDSASGAVLDGATVSLLRLPDSALVRETRSVKNGFIFRRLAPGSYAISASFVGYRKTAQSFTVAAVDTLLQLAAIKMPASAEHTMMEVIVRASIPPVVSKADTLVYQASAFKTRPNAPVEELLKKLPGVQVDKDGGVTVNGQKVDKFYIDGKEIPITDTRALTQSLTADMISGIEAFDRQSDDSRFSGVRDNDNAKALNFKVKKEFQQSLSGRAFAGYGQHDFYGVGGRAFYLAPDTKVQIGISRNNSNDLINALSNKPFVAGNGISSHTRANLMGATRLSQNIAANGGYNFNDDQTNNQRTENRQTFAGDSSLLLQHLSAGQSNNKAHSLNGKIQFELDSSTELTVSPRLSISRQKSGSMDAQQLQVQKTTITYLSSTATTNTNSVSDQWDAGAELNLRHRFHKKGETIRFRVQGLQHGQTSDKNFLSNTLSYDSAGSLINHSQLNQQSHQTAPVTNLGATIGYTYPIGRALVLDGSYDVGSRRQKSDKATYNYNTVTKQYDLPDSLTTNRFTSTLLTHRFGLGLNHSSKLLSYQAGLSLQYSDQQSRNFVGPGQDFSLYQLNWFPRAGFFYSINKQNQLNLQYNGNTQGATIDQLQPLPDFSNPLLVKKGNPDLHPEFDHSATLGYQHFSRSRLQSILLQFAFNVQQNKFTPATTILAGGVQQLQYVNTNGNYSGSFSAGYNFPFAGGRKGNCKLSSGVSYSHLVSYTNGQENIQTSFGWDPQLSVNYSPLDRLLLEAEAGLDFNHTAYTVGNRRLDQLNQRYELGLSYDLPAGLLITSDLLAQVTGAQGSLKGLTQNIWNASISKRIFPTKTAEIRASVFDILDSNKGFSQTVGENYISTSTNLVLSRSLYVSFIYYFKRGLKTR
jgi:hypothetical protein